MYVAMNIRDEGCIKAHSSTELMDDRDQGKEILTCHAEGNVFGLHEDGTTNGQNDGVSTAASAVGVQGFLMSRETCKVCIRVAIHTRSRGWCNNEAFVHGTFQIAPAANEGQFMATSWVEGIASTLVNCKGNIGA